MPDHTVFRIPVIRSFDALHSRPDTEKLLVTGYFLHIVIVKSEKTNQFQQPLPGEQGDNRSILFVNQSVRADIVAFFLLPLIVFFPPYTKVLGKRTAGTVFDGIGVHGHNDLGKFEQVGDIAGPPVAHILGNAFFHINAGFFTLDYHQRNAVDEQHNVRARIFAVWPFHREFISYLPDIVFRLLPVDKLQVERLAAAVKQLLIVAVAGE
jgi:hypothetical protein